MMEEAGNNDNDNDSDSDSDSDSNTISDNEHEEGRRQRRRAIAEAAAMAARKRRKLKLNTILDRQEDFPCRQRNGIDEMVEEFIERLGKNIHHMLCDRRHSRPSGNTEPDYADEFYQGLDCDRDTEKEVETALEIFPELLSRPTEDGRYPIQCICFLNNHSCNIKAVPFLTVLARAGIDFNTDFDKEDRGGLLITGALCEEDRNGYMKYTGCSTEIVLDLLMKSSDSSYGEEHNQIVDNVLLTQLVRLKQLNLLHPEDIRNYKLVDQVCDHGYYFAEQRFRFLIEWDPTLLLETVDSDYGRLPLHYAACKWSIQEFRIVFEYCIRYYPRTKGIALVFRKEEEDSDKRIDDALSTTGSLFLLTGSTWSDKLETPFQYACKKFGSDTVLKVIEDILIRYSTEGTPLHVVEALIPAAIDDNIHLDCVNFLLRREPGILTSLVSTSSEEEKESAESQSTTTINITNNDDNSDSIIRKSEDDGRSNNNDDGNGSHRDGYDDGVDDDDILVGENSKRMNGKRKRES